MPIVPARIAFVRRIARCTSEVHAVADKPYSVSLAIRTASSSSANGMTERTGPKISSLAMDMSLVTSVKTSAGVRETTALQVSEVRLAAGVGIDLRAVDEHPDRAAEHVQRIARPDHQVGVLAWL